MYDDGEFFPVCPADLLLGRASNYRGTRLEDELGLGVAERLERLETFVSQWWKRWQDAAFLMFTPRKKWLVERRNMREGDVVLLLSNQKLGPGTFRLGVVKEALPDFRGVVRSVVVCLRNRRRRGAASGTEDVRMGVQRLAVILPVEEKWVGGEALPNSE